MEVQMKQVAKSSNVRAYGYDAATSTLVVVFKDGARYHYDKVPSERITEMNQEVSQGGSVGKYIHARIKGYYDGQKVEA